MIESNPSNVSSAFEMLLEEVEAETGFMAGVESGAFAARGTGMARDAAANSKGKVFPCVVLPPRGTGARTTPWFGGMNPWERGRA